MAALTEAWSAIEIRSVIRFLRLKKNSPAEIHRQLVEVYGTSVMSRKQVWFWCTEFDKGRTDLRDEERSGRPSTSTSDDNVCRAEALIQGDRCINLREIAQELNISFGSAQNIVHEQLGYRKTCARWVPRQLTDDQKATRMGLCLEHLMRFHREGMTFLHRIVTGDETWVHHVTPTSKQASMSWKHPSSPPRKKFKTTPSAKKVMATVFWDHQGVLLVDFLTHGSTVNAPRYCTTLGRLRDAIRRKRPGLLTTGVLLLHDNARPHTATATRDLLQRFRWQVLDHPPYSPDLAPSDFHLFGPLKKHLGGLHFRTDAEVQQAVLTWLHNLDADFFHAGFDGLVYRWNKCFDKHGDYVEK